MNYRRLGPKMKFSVEEPMRLADDCEKVTVAEEFSTEFCASSCFSGEVCLGCSNLWLPGGTGRATLACGMIDAQCTWVGDNCCIENIQNHTANYEQGMTPSLRM